MRALPRALLIFIALSAVAQNPRSPEPGSSGQQPPQQPTPSTADSEHSSRVLPDSTHLILVKKIPVFYPLSAEKRKLQGPVVVQLSISQDGSVEAVDKVTGDDDLLKAVEDALKEWKFDPYIKNGNPVKASTKLSFNFIFCDSVIDEGSGIVNAAGDPAGDSPGSITIVRLPTSVEKKIVIHKTAPRYPEMAKLARVTGKVLLRVNVAKDGTIERLHVISSDSPLLNQATIDAVKQWTFKPYLLRGVPTAYETGTVITYSVY